MSILADYLERDRLREGLSVARASYLLGLTGAQYRALLEDKHPTTADTWERIVDLYGWPQTFSVRP